MVYQTEAVMAEIVDRGTARRRGNLLRSLEMFAAPGMERAMLKEGYEAYAPLVSRHTKSARALLNSVVAEGGTQTRQLALLQDLSATSSRLRSAVARVDCVTNMIDGQVPDQGAGANPKQAVNAAGEESGSNARTQFTGSPAPTGSGSEGVFGRVSELGASLRLRFNPQVGSFVSLLLSLVAAYWFYENRRKSRRRKFKRYLCDLPVLLELDADRMECQLVDVSKMGGKLNVSLEIGQRLRVNSTIFQRQGRVTWANAVYCGVLFDDPLSNNQIRQTVATTSRAA